MPLNRPGRFAPAGRGSVFTFSSALILAAAALLSACGLETVVIYESPSFTPETGFLSLMHNVANDADSSFLGYEIYYRVYDNYEEANAARDAIEAVINQSFATPDSCMSKLESMKYRRLVNFEGSDVRPLFKRPAFVADKLKIYYGADWYVDEFPVAQKAILRWTKVLLNSQYSPGEEDYAGSTILTSGSSAHFVFFAVAYGFDIPAGFKEINSIPRGTGNVISVPISY